MTTEELQIVLALKDEATAAMRNAAENLSGSLGSVLSLLNVRLLTAAAAVGGFTYEMKACASAAAEEEAQLARLGRVVENSGVSWRAVSSEVEQTVNQLKSLTGVGDNQIRDALTRMVQMTGNYEASMKNLTIVLDIAASGMMDVGSAARMVAFAMEGNVQMLGRLLPEFRSLDAEMLDNMTTTERAEFALNKLKESFGGLAETMGSTTQGALNKLSNAWQDLQVIVGKGMLEAITEGAGSMEDWLKRITPEAEEFGKTVGEVLKAIMEGIGILLPMLDGLIDKITFAADWWGYKLGSMKLPAEYLGLEEGPAAPQMTKAEYEAAVARGAVRQAREEAEREASKLDWDEIYGTSPLDTEGRTKEDAKRQKEIDAARAKTRDRDIEESNKEALRAFEEGLAKEQADEELAAAATERAVTAAIGGVSGWEATLENIRKINAAREAAWAASGAVGGPSFQGLEAIVQILQARIVEKTIPVEFRWMEMGITGQMEASKLARYQRQFGMEEGMSRYMEKVARESKLVGGGIGGFQEPWEQAASAGDLELARWLAGGKIGKRPMTRAEREASDWAEQQRRAIDQEMMAAAARGERLPESVAEMLAKQDENAKDTLDGLNKLRGEVRKQGIDTQAEISKLCGCISGSLCKCFSENTEDVIDEVKKIPGGEEYTPYFPKPMLNIMPNNVDYPADRGDVITTVSGAPK